MVVIYDDWILFVNGTMDPPVDAYVEDYGNATILPGLIDPHVHLAFDASEDSVRNLMRRTDAEVSAAVIKAGQKLPFGAG